MSFLEHLDELRKRIINSCIAIAVGVLAGFGFINRLVDFILGPTRRALPPGVKMIYTQPGEAFSLYVQIALNKQSCYRHRIPLSSRTSCSFGIADVRNSEWVVMTN